jgi:hypothetical protein
MKGSEDTLITDPKSYKLRLFQFFNIIINDIHDQ